MESLVSIVIPVYNVENYLDRCIQSVINQTYKNLQIILVDDGSTDSSGMICDEYGGKDFRITVLHTENKGVSSARNTGIIYATGEFLMFVDADDALETYAIEQLIHQFLIHDVDVITYGWSIVDENSQSFVAKKEAYVQLDDKAHVIHRILEHYSAYGGGYPWNKIWKLSSVQMQHFDEELFYFEDLEWTVRMLIQIKKMMVFPECLYQYYVHESGVTHSSSKDEEKELSYHKALQKIIVNLESVKDEQVWFVQKYTQELVNGILDATRKKRYKLQNQLVQYTHRIERDIYQYKNVQFNIKVRCFILMLLYRLRIIGEKICLK